MMFFCDSSPHNFLVFSFFLFRSRACFHMMCGRPCQLREKEKTMLVADFFYSHWKKRSPVYELKCSDEFECGIIFVSFSPGLLPETSFAFGTQLSLVDESGNLDVSGATLISCGSSRMFTQLSNAPPGLYNVSFSTPSVFR